MTRPLIRDAVLLFCVAFITRIAPAHAQAEYLTDSGRYLSQGVLLPPTSISTIESPFALTLNPAGLLFNSTGVAYLHEDGTKAAVGARRSDALFLRLGGLSASDDIGLAAGFSLEWIRPAGGGCFTDAPCLRRTSFGIAIGSPVFSIGAAYRWYDTSQNPSIDNMQTFDVGLTLRPATWLTAALVADALNAPAVNRIAIPRVYTASLGVRPFSRWLTLAVDYSVDDHTGWRGSRLSYLADFRLPHGLELMAQLAHMAESQPDGQRIVLEVGLHGDFGYGGLWLAEGQQITDSTGGVSGVVAADLHVARAEPLLTPKPTAELLDLGKELKRPFGIAELLGWGPVLDPYTSLVLHLEQLESDDGLDTLIVVVRGLDGVSLGRVEELRARFKELRANGKKIVTWLESGGDTEYYLASAADRVYAAPEAMLHIDGLSTTHVFLRGLLDKLGIQPEFVKQGAYKSAPEQFTNTQSSPAAAEETNSLLDDRYARYIAAIANSRKMGVDQMRKIVSQGVFTAPEALQAGLIDGLCAGGSALIEAANDVSGRRLRFSYADWPSQMPIQWGKPDSIAIVELVGNIVASSPSSLLGNFAGAENIVKKLRSAARDPSVKAIVLRIDSPGGDVGASELIYQAVLQAKKRKPVIASFGDVAASGGYYVASPANEIIAEPSTITGSIGVFAGKADLSKLFDKVGVTTEIYKRGDHADLFTLTRPWTPDERRIVEGQVASFYETFLAHVADGRKMTRDQVHAIAQGRVWTGAQAKERGLVDHMGGLEEALREARRLGGLRPKARVVVPGANGLFDLPDMPEAFELMRGGQRQASVPPLLAALRELLSSGADRQALDDAWPVLQGLVIGRPLALAVDPPVVR